MTHACGKPSLYLVLRHKGREVARRQIIEGYGKSIGTERPADQLSVERDGEELWTAAIDLNPGDCAMLGEAVRGETPVTITRYTRVVADDPCPVCGGEVHEFDHDYSNEGDGWQGGPGWVRCSSCRRSWDWERFKWGFEAWESPADEVRENSEA